MNEKRDETGPRRDSSGALRGPWLLASALGLFAAGLFWFAGWAEAAFVAAALGIVSWFLNVRATLPRAEDDSPDDDDAYGSDEDDDSRV